MERRRGDRAARRMEADALDGALEVDVEVGLHKFLPRLGRAVAEDKEILGGLIDSHRQGGVDFLIVSVVGGKDCLAVVSVEKLGVLRFVEHEKFYVGRVARFGFARLPAGRLYERTVAPTQLRTCRVGGDL